MTAELDVLKDVTERLEGARISYMLTGSFALSYYAEPRMTRDLDLVVALESFDAGRVAGLFSADYYVSEDDVVRAIRDYGMFNILHLTNLVKVDLIVRKPSEYRRHEFERRQRVPFPGFPAWIVSKEDLILSKLVWSEPTGSELQRRDVTRLLGTGVDETYLQDWAVRLGVDGLLELCRDAGHDA